MTRETIVACAVTGSPLKFHTQRNFPITPEQTAAELSELLRRQL